MPTRRAGPACAFVAFAWAVFAVAIAAVGRAAEKAGNEPAAEKAAASESTDAADDSFDGQIRAAWQALAKRDVAAAKTAIAAAAGQAADAGQKKEAAQMQILAGSIEQFWRAIDAELKRLQPGDELDLAGSKAAVVESKADSLTLHIEGKNQKKSRAALPGRWALALAEHRFDNSPANKRLLGAFLAVDPQGDRKRARQLWQQAQRGEPVAGELVTLLDSANIPAAAGGKEMADGKSDGGKPGAAKPGAAQPGDPGEVPSKEKLTAAGKRLKETYGADIRGAKTPEDKLELSQTLVRAAAETDDDAWRLALLRQALDLAAGAGKIAAMDEIVETMRHWFKIDAWEVNAEAFTRADAAAKAASIGDVVRRSLTLLADWDDQEAKTKKGHAKAAQKLEQAALAAAQRAHDPDLVGSVVDRKKQAQADPKN
jgi:hypothetical protein